VIVVVILVVVVVIAAVVVFEEFYDNRRFHSTLSMCGETQRSSLGCSWWIVLFTMLPLNDVTDDWVK
jgi:predicted Na+-dependent transporter